MAKNIYGSKVGWCGACDTQLFSIYDRKFYSKNFPCEPNEAVLYFYGSQGLVHRHQPTIAHNILRTESEVLAPD